MSLVFSPMSNVIGGRRERALGGDAIPVRFPIPIQAGEARAHAVAERAGEGAGNLLVLGRAVLRGELAAKGAAGAPARLVVDAAGRRTAVQHRGGTLEDVHRVERVEIHADRVDRGRDRRGKPVDVLLGRKAAHADEVEAQVGTVVLALHARGVAHGLLAVDEVEQVDLIARDHRDRLRSLDQRDVRLVRGLRADRHVPAGRHDDHLLTVLGRGHGFIGRAGVRFVAAVLAGSWALIRRPPQEHWPKMRV